MVAIIYRKLKINLMKKVFTILSIFIASQTMGQQILVDGQSATRKFIGIEP